MKGVSSCDEPESAAPLRFTELYSEFQLIVYLFWFTLSALIVSFSDEKL